MDRLRGAPGGGQVRGSWDFIYRGWSLRFLVRCDLNEMTTGLCIMTDRDECARQDDDCNTILLFTLLLSCFIPIPQISILLVLRRKERW